MRFFLMPIAPVNSLRRECRVAEHWLFRILKQTSLPKQEGALCKNFF